MALIGHCNCKAITVTIQDYVEGEAPTVLCHCTTCKRQSGGFGIYVIGLDSDQVKIEDPQGVQKTWEDTLTRSGTILNRHFCGVCSR